MFLRVIAQNLKKILLLYINRKELDFLKFFKKSRKKVLTRGDDVCIMIKLSKNGAPESASRMSKKLQKTLKKVLKSG